jgi:CBS domain-containing protein
VITTKVGTKTMEAYDMMRKKMVKKLPVVDENDVLVGM